MRAEGGRPQSRQLFDLSAKVAYSPRVKFDAHTAFFMQKNNSLLRLPFFQVVAFAALVVGCGVEEKCPQGSVSVDGQCFLEEETGFQVDIPDLEASSDAQLVEQLDTVEGDTSLDDATNVVAPDSLPDMTAWERVETGPLWHQRVEFLSTETAEHDLISRVQRRPEQRMESDANLNPPTHFVETLCLAKRAEHSPEMKKTTALRPEKEAKHKIAESFHVDRSLRGLVNGKYNDKKDVNQRGCGRKSRRDCREWPPGQSGVGNTLKGAV